MSRTRRHPDAAALARAGWSKLHLRSIDRAAALVGVLLIATPPTPAIAQQVHHESPINYRQSTPDNCVTRLQTRINSGETALHHDEKWGYLPAVLGALSVPESSQALVFSKTSLQVERISPRRPRAIYFGDDVYVAWVQKSGLMELSAVDPQLGAVFYTLKHEKSDRPTFVRKNASCLACHATRHTGYVPGHVVFSVFSDAHGSPIASAGFSSTDHTSPFRDRWGGWYVTGHHGKQRHRGNQTMRFIDRPEHFDYERGANQTNLDKWVDVEPYLTPHSDLVALMVMEHQTMVQNHTTAANYHGRIVAEHAKAGGSKSKSNANQVAQLKLDLAVERLVDSLLLVREAPLTEPISGTSGFAKAFSAKGPRDAKGRSLRQFDLRTRLFRFPCSYLIYSEAFDGLPKPVRHSVYRQLWRVLSGDETGRKYQHLSEQDRQAITEILRATKPELADVWPKG